jgi:probable F420-dependent oxidoreductase
VRFGAHLPQIGFSDGQPGWTPARLIEYARHAEQLGFDRICVNDHLVFPRPWLDGLAALALVLPYTERAELMSTVALPVVRGPVALAKTLASLDVLSGGHVVAGVGPGSSPRDYEAVGLPFDDRWRRLDESIKLLRGLWGGPPFSGRFYSSEGVVLEPKPLRPGGPPIWIGSWGSDAGLRRVARLADGWLASAYNTEPHIFREALERLKERLVAEGKGQDSFPNALATAWTYVTEDAAKAERVITDVIAPMTGRDVDELRRRLLVGPAESCVEKLAAYRDAGLQAVFIWPVADELEQLGLFAERVAPLIA